MTSPDGPNGNREFDRAFGDFRLQLHLGDMRDKKTWPDRGPAMKTPVAAKGTRERLLEAAGGRLESFYPKIIRSFRGLPPDRVHEYFAEVACSILASPRAVRSLATTPTPAAYLRQSVRNAIHREHPPDVLETAQRMEPDGDIPRGSSRSALAGQAWHIPFEMELPRPIAGLLQPARAVMVLWTRGYTDAETERTIGMPRDLVRYYVSSRIAKLRDGSLNAA